MPEEFEGDRSILASLMVGIPAVVAGGMVVKGIQKQDAAIFASTQALDPYTQIVTGRYRSFFEGIEKYAPDLGEIPSEVQGYIVESLRRRVGPSAIRLETMADAVIAAKEMPAVNLLLKQAVEEFRGVKAGALVEEALAGLTPLAVTTEGGAALTNIGAVRKMLAQPSLGIAAGMQEKLANELVSLGVYAKDFLDATPSFSYQVVGKDRAVSEMVINFNRKTGGEVKFKVPLPNESGVLTRANGSQAAARRIPGNLRQWVEGVEELELLTAPEAAIKRLREIIPQADFPAQARAMEAEIRQLLVTTPTATPEKAMTFAQQVVMDPWREHPPALRHLARDKFGLAGLSAGVPPGPLAKGVFWAPGAAPAQLTPPHYGQAMTKAFPDVSAAKIAEWEGATGMKMGQLFQVSPEALLEAGGQLGMAEMVPRTDQILMAREAEDVLKGVLERRITIDPSAPAASRLKKIMTMLQDNETTQQMLTGGSSVEETMAAYMAEMSGTPQAQAMAKARFVEEGEIMGFTAAGAERAKTYGLDTMIKDIETVGDRTTITTRGYYTPQKIFSPGGVKHGVEYAYQDPIRKLGVRGKALELLQAQGITTYDPSDPAFAAKLRQAEIEAEQLYKGSMGLIVEGKDWETWEKTAAGEKNFSRFNDMMREKYMAEFGAIPEEVAALPPGQFRGALEELAATRGVDPQEFFHPTRLAARMEELKLGDPAGFLGIGGRATFTEDAFQIMKSHGWKDIFESMAMRADVDFTAQQTLIRAGEAVRSTVPGMTIPEMVEQGFIRPGEAGVGTIFDIEGRARFFEATGGRGVIELPQAYRVGGKTISRIAIPEMPGGHTGHFTTPDGRQIHKQMDLALRDLMSASIADVGASATTAAELAGTEPLGRYFDVLGEMSVRERDIYGGKIIGSRKFAVGKEIPGAQVRRVAPEVAERMGLEGRFAEIPFKEIAPAAFEEQISAAMGEGLITEEFAAGMRTKFYQGELPSVIMKHPGRGMSTIPVYVRPARDLPQLGYTASRTYANLSQSLHSMLTADLDFDPLESDLLFTEAAMGEATQALESGVVSQAIQDEARLMEILGDIKADPTKGPPVFLEGGEINPQYIVQKLQRDAAAKEAVGKWTTGVSWPAGVAAEEAGFTAREMAKVRVWRNAIEEAGAHKLRHKLGLSPAVIDEMTEAWKAGKGERMGELMEEMFGQFSPRHRSEFQEMLTRLIAANSRMGAEGRRFAEARYASRGRAGARTFLDMADRTTSTRHSAGRFATAVTGENARFGMGAGRVLSQIGDTLRAHKKTALIGLGVSAALAAITARPRDLTPEAVTSGQLVGQQVRPSLNTPPLPRFEKNVHYSKGTRPGYRIKGNTGRVVDHTALAQTLGGVTGGQSSTVRMVDNRRRLHKDDVEMAMRKDAILGARMASSGYYNGSRYK